VNLSRNKFGSEEKRDWMYLNPQDLEMTKGTKIFTSRTDNGGNYKELKGYLGLLNSLLEY
tara:strand:+ start:257 stop:436 length:180 start_codon:yes stop_codon:yes gene_type:complete